MGWVLTEAINGLGPHLSLPSKAGYTIVEGERNTQEIVWQIFANAR